MAGNAPKRVGFANTVQKQPFYKSLETLQVPYGPKSNDFEVAPVKANRTPLFAERPWNAIPKKARAIRQLSAEKLAAIQAKVPNYEPSAHSMENAYARATELHGNVYAGEPWSDEENYNNLNNLANEWMLGRVPKRAKQGSRKGRTRRRTQRRSQRTRKSY